MRKVEKSDQECPKTKPPLVLCSEGRNQAVNILGERHENDYF